MKTLSNQYSLSEYKKCKMYMHTVILELMKYSIYSPFHKTLPKSSLQMPWVSARVYEMGVICTVCIPVKNTETPCTSDRKHIVLISVEEKR